MIEIGFLLGFAIYAIVWFLVLFMVLPFGVVTQSEVGQVVAGSAESAPVITHIGRKMVIATLLAVIFYALIYWLLTRGVLAEFELPFLSQVSSKK